MNTTPPPIPSPDSGSTTTQNDFEFDADFNGPDYNAIVDKKRLTGQLKRIFFLMRDGVWRTLPEIEAVTGDGQASISAQLRHLRKRKFGAHNMTKRRRGDVSDGYWEYRVDPAQGSNLSAR